MALFTKWLDCRIDEAVSPESLPILFGAYSVDDPKTQAYYANKKDFLFQWKAYNELITELVPIQAKEILALNKVNLKFNDSNKADTRNKIATIINLD